MLVIAGDGIEKSKLMRQIFQSNLTDQVTFVGQVKGVEKAWLLSNCCFLVQPSRYEGFPNSVLEAISCGLPVVGFDSGAMPELCFFSKDLLAYVSEDIFQKYEDFDYHKLAEKILSAVQNYDHYREVALAHSHLYSFEECGQRYLEIFQRYGFHILYHFRRYLRAIGLRPHIVDSGFGGRVFWY